MKYATYFTIPAICLLLNSCNGNGTKQVNNFSNYLREQGYSFYNPPRTDRGPSSIFRFETATSGATSIVPVCKRLFENIEISEAVIAIPKENSKEQVTVNFAFNLLGDVLNENASAETHNFIHEKAETEFSGMRALSIADEDLYNKDGTAKKITPSCLQALKSLKISNKLDRDVFIVQESIRVDSVKYTFSKNSESSTQANFDIKNLLEIKPDVKYSFLNENSIKVDQPIYVAFKAFRLKSFEETGLTGPGSAIVKFEGN